MGELKMYYLNPNDYGQEYFTIANGKEEALENILKYLREKCKGYLTNHYEKEFVMVQEIINSKYLEYPQKYTLDEYTNGGVIESELC